MKYNTKYKLGRTLGMNSKNSRRFAKKGCYIATAVYGSYNCPEVWVLRRFRDYKLSKTMIGRLFIRLYYFLSPIAVKLFGKTRWFQNFWRNKLNKMVIKLINKGYSSLPYND